MTLEKKKAIYRKCEKCGYRQKLKDKRRGKKSWKCSDCGKQNKLAIVAVVALLAIILPATYAATEVTVFLPINKQWDDSRCAFNFWLDAESGIPKGQNVCSWDWTFLMEAFDFLPDPETPTFEEYEKSLIDYLNDIEDKTPAEIVKEFTEPIEPEVPQFMKALEAKKLESVEALTALEKLLRDCEAIKERWSKIQDSDYIESLEIPKTMFVVDDYATAGKQGDFNLMFEACRGMIGFQDVLTALENKIVDAEAVFLTPIEVDVLHQEHEQKQADAAQAKIDEAVRALKWRCEPEQVKQGLCKEHLDEVARDPNQGGFSYDAEGNIIGTVDCGYYYVMVDIGKRKKIPQKVEFCISDERARVDRENISPEELDVRQKQEQCDEYMPHYAHQDIIPEFLAHCEGYKTPAPEEEQQTEESCPDCPKEQFEVGERHCYVAGRGEVDCEKYDADKAAKEKDN